MAEETLVVGTRRFVASEMPAAAVVRPYTDARQAPLVFVIFVAVQVLDGAFTYWGVTRFGIDVEMNALLASSMHSLGPAATLVAAKLMACACGLLLYAHAYFRALAVVSGLCLGIAVIPWLAFWVYALKAYS